MKQKERERWANLPKERQRNTRLLSQYGITYQDLVCMLESQGGACKICKTPVKLDLNLNSFDKACVDHCHDSGKVRGVLCNHCNRALGMAKDDISILEAMIKYLRDNN